MFDSLSSDERKAALRNIREQAIQGNVITQQTPTFAINTIGTSGMTTGNGPWATLTAANTASSSFVASSLAK